MIHAHARDPRPAYAICRRGWRWRLEARTTRRAIAGQGRRNGTRGASFVTPETLRGCQIPGASRRAWWLLVCVASSHSDSHSLLSLAGFEPCR